jgi:NtrC-family two-component system response regulator AlgB
VITLHLPPLRERSEDILTLADRFLARFVKEYARPARGFSDEARKHCSTIAGRATSASCATWWSAPASSARRSAWKSATWAWPSNPPATRHGRRRAEPGRTGKRPYRAVLAASDTLDQAAKTLGIDASTLYRKRKQYNL